MRRHLTFDRDSNMPPGRTGRIRQTANTRSRGYAGFLFAHVHDAHAGFACGEQKHFTIASDDKTCEINIRMGAEEKIALPDGSKVAANR